MTGLSSTLFYKEMDSPIGSDGEEQSDLEYEVLIRRDMIDPDIDEVGHKSRATYIIYEPKQRQFKV